MAKRLVGGSAGMTKTSYTHPYVQANVKLVEPGENQVIRGRLLPAFEKDIHGNITAPDSFVPYRVERQEGDEHALFSDWFVEISGYRMLGPNKLRFLSPATGVNNPPGGIDPLIDLYRASRQSEDPAIKWFSDKHDDKQARQRALQWPSRMHIVNFLMLNEENTLDNVILKLSSKGMEALQMQLNNPWTRGCPERQHFGEYCFGDVLAPDSGLWCTIKPFKFNDAGMNTAGVFFGRKTNQWDGVEAFPFDPQAEDGQIYLRGRYDMCDAEQVIRLADRKEMVNAIFSGVPWLPYEWASSVLLELGYEVPNNPHRSTVVSQPAGSTTASPAAVSTPRSVSPAVPRTAPSAASSPATTATNRPAPAPRPAPQPASPRPAVATRPTPQPATPRPSGSTQQAPQPSAPRPAVAPRPTVATTQPFERPALAPKPPVMPEPEAAPLNDEAAEAEAGLAPVDIGDTMTPELEQELSELETALQNDPAAFPETKMARFAALVNLRDASAAPR